MPRMLFRPSRRLLPTGALAAFFVAAAIASGAWAETAFEPAAPRPTLPASGGPKPTSPIVDSLVEDTTLVLHVRKAAERPHRHEARIHHRRAARYYEPPVERPALASVALLQPLPRPGEPPHIVVPLPAYALDPVFLPITMPPPPIVCHPVRRDPSLPDPRLYRERTVVCEADNP